MGRRRLRNTVLDFLSSNKGPAAATRAKKQFDTADCMTDRMAGLMTLASIGARSTACVFVWFAYGSASSCALDERNTTRNTVDILLHGISSISHEVLSEGSITLSRSPYPTQYPSQIDLSSSSNL